MNRYELHYILNGEVKVDRYRDRDWDKAIQDLYQKLKEGATNCEIKEVRYQVANIEQFNVEDLINMMKHDYAVFSMDRAKTQSFVDVLKERKYQYAVTTANDIGETYYLIALSDW